jgi:hypothetical protein
MGLENLIQVSFTDEELQKINGAFQEIVSVLEGKTVKLSAEERRQYGSIAEQNKLFVNKAKELMGQYPQFVPQFVKKDEFDRDYQARVHVEGLLQRLKSISEQLSDTKILLDHDNYNASLSFYRHLRYLNEENMPGIKSVFDALKQFFKGGRPNGKDAEPTSTSEQASAIV